MSVRVATSGAAALLAGVLALLGASVPSGPAGAAAAATVPGATGFRLAETWELGRWVTWQPSPAATAYRVVRIDLGTAQSTSVVVPGSSTGELDFQPGAYCYQLLTYAGTTAVAHSPVLCKEGVQTDDVVNPLAVSIGLDAQDRPVLRWVTNPAGLPFPFAYVVQQDGQPDQVLPVTADQAVGAPITTSGCLLLAEVGPGAFGTGPRFCVFTDASATP
jgi:hypothetical protein